MMMAREFDRKVDITAEKAMELFPEYTVRLNDGEDIYYLSHKDILNALSEHNMDDNYNIVFSYYNTQVNVITYNKN